MKSLARMLQAVLIRSSGAECLLCVTEFNESAIGRVVNSRSKLCGDTDTLQQGGLLCDDGMFVYVCLGMCV